MKVNCGPTNAQWECMRSLESRYRELIDYSDSPKDRTPTPHIPEDFPITRLAEAPRKRLD